VRQALVLEDDADLRTLLCEVLEFAGVECCLAAASLGELMRLPGAPASELALLDLELGPAQPSGIEAWRWLRSQGFSGRAVFLTGQPRVHPLVSAGVRGLPGVEVLAKPVDAEALLRLVGDAGASQPASGP
jgi:CheY-like chemotaxis protein